MKKKIKAVSLFAGVGGIDLGFQMAGFKTIWANDCDKNAIVTYRANFSNPIIEEKIENIKEEEIPNADIILFGFPCTSFSIAGYRKGFKDENTGHLFFEALRVVQNKNPEAIFIENVKNLVSHDNGKTFMIIKDALEDAGYYLRYQVLNGMNYGNVPQNRERIYIVGFKDKEKCDRFYFPEPIPLSKTIQDIIKPHERKPDKYYYKRGKTKYYDLLEQSITKKNTVYQLRRVYVRENKSNVCPTLTANMGTGGHNVPIVMDDFGIRKLTPKECFLFQGYPDNFILPDLADSHLYKQAGNSVVVPVIERIAQNIKCLFE